MNPFKTLLTLAAGIALTVTAHAQTTVNSFDRNGYCDFSRTTFQNGATATTVRNFDQNGNCDYSRTTYTDPTVVASTPAPTPIYVRRAVVLDPAFAPVRNVPSAIQQPAIVVNQSATEMHADSLAGAARVKAQNAAASHTKQATSVLSN